MGIGGEAPLLRRTPDVGRDHRSAAGQLPGKNANQIRDAIRGVVRRDPRYKGQKQEYESDRLIELCEEDAKSPRRILTAHGLDPDKWDVVTCRNNLWHSQTKAGTRLVMYQSRLTARPKDDGITFADIERWFAEKDFTPTKTAEHSSALRSRRRHARDNGA